MEYGFRLHSTVLILNISQSTSTLMKVGHNYSRIKRNQLLPGLVLWCHIIQLIHFMMHRVTHTSQLPTYPSPPAASVFGWWGQWGLSVVAFPSWLTVECPLIWLYWSFWIWNHLSLRGFSLCRLAGYKMHRTFHNVSLRGTHCRRLALSLDCTDLLNFITFPFKKASSLSVGALQSRQLPISNEQRT